MQQKIKCDCGSIISKQYLSGHIKSKKHQKYLESLVEIEFID